MIVEVDPVPHVVIDDVLPAAAFDRIHRHWPAGPLFTPEVAGNYLFHFSPLAQARLGVRQTRFWAAFHREVYDDLVRRCLAAFAPWIAPWHLPLERLFWGHDYLSLMQSDPRYPGHGIHTHHYHDPTFLFTLLLYLGPAREGTAGTCLHGLSPPYPPTEELARLARRELPLAGDWPWTTTRIDYVPNRLVAFLDGPLAFHSVPPATNVDGDTATPSVRRVLRAHVQAPHSPCIERRYGVSWGEYKTEARLGSASDRALRWIEKDIAEHFHPDSIAAHAARPGACGAPALPKIFEAAHLWHKTARLGYRTARSGWSDIVSRLSSSRGRPRARAGGSPMSPAPSCVANRRDELEP